MWQVYSIARFEFWWQLRRRIPVFAQAVGMLLPLVDSVHGSDDIISLLASQSRVFLVLAPLCMGGAVSRDVSDGVNVLLLAAGVKFRSYPVAKWLGLVAMQVALLSAVCGFSAAALLISHDAKLLIRYVAWFLTIFGPALLMVCALGLVADALTSNPWRAYPFVLAVGVGSLLVNSPLTLGYNDTAAEQFAVVMRHASLQFGALRWSLYGSGAISLTFAYSAGNVIWRGRGDR